MYRKNTKVITYIKDNGQKIKLVRFFAPNKISPVMTQKTYLHPTDIGTNIKWTKEQRYNMLVRHSKIGRNLRHRLDKKISHNQDCQLNSILLWMCENKGTSNNKIKCSYKELSNVLNIKYSSVVKIFNTLKYVNLVKVHGNNMFLNPLWTYACTTASDGYNQLLNAFDDYYFSNQEWWKHMTTNDEFTINNKFKFN